MSEKETIEAAKSKKTLSGSQKLLFTIFCWGIHSWGQATNFKNQGYQQKYLDAKKAMYTGLVIYGVGIIIIILYLVLKN